jgi:tetratricopeptide (TPR) repeat protein
VAFPRTARERALAIALALGAFAVGIAPLADGDLWWHLAAGREIVHTHSVLRVDPFSITAAGRPWFDVHWLFQVASYGVYCLGGLTGIVLAKCLLVAAGALLLHGAVVRAAGWRGGALFVTAFLGALFCARQLLLARPVIVTLVFTAVFFVQLERHRLERRPRPLFLLPVAQIAWANFQGLFALGPAIVAAYALGAALGSRPGGRSWFPLAHERPPVPHERRTPIPALPLVLVLCLLASFATPYGRDAVLLPLKLFSRLLPVQGNVYSTNVAENVPPFNLHEATAAQFWHLKWFLGFLLVSLGTAGRRVPLAHWLVAAGLATLALMGNRNILLLYWLGTPIAVMALWAGTRSLRALARRSMRAERAAWLWFVPLAALLVLVAGAAIREPNLREAAPFRTPTQSAQVIEQRSGRGTIFAADEYGGYLIWRLFPRYRPYMDTRLILRTATEFAQYLALAEHPDRFDSLQREQGFDYVVLPVGYPDRYLNLIAHLYSSKDWKLVFTDGAETLFARSLPGDTDGWDLRLRPTSEKIVGGLERRFADSPQVREAALLQLATLEIAVQAFDEAERVLDATSSQEGEGLRARARLASGDLAGAQESAEKRLEKNADDVRSLNVMAMVLLRRGQARPALSLLRRALAADPFDSEAEQILSSLEQHVESHP